MLEFGARQLPEKDLVSALRFAHSHLPPLIALQHELRALVGKPKRTNALLRVPPLHLTEAVHKLIYEDARALYRDNPEYKKAERGAAQKNLLSKLKDAPELQSLSLSERELVPAAAEIVTKRAIRSVVTDAAATSPSTNVDPMDGRPIIGKKKSAQSVYISADGAACRPDGRATTAIRRLAAEVDVLPLVHGSALFSRGDTQVVCTATLAPANQGPQLASQQMNWQARPPTPGSPAAAAKAAPPVAWGSGAEGERKAFFLHYDFPPYCNNEVCGLENFCTLFNNLSLCRLGRLAVPPIAGCWATVPWPSARWRQ
jgi:polyribonucleotide nucleotidyltransferase